MVSDSESSSVGKESQFETLYEQDFQALRQECLNTGTLFEDLEFLPREEFLRRLIHNNPIPDRRQSPQKKPPNFIAECVTCSVADPHQFDADPDSDLGFHFDANSNPTIHFLPL
jgi:hypothetical protein